jgi:penicillin-binding protein 1A
LRRGLQPNTLVRDQQITLPPINGSYNARDRDYWTPKNADGGGGGITTPRRGLENSKNLVTANLLDGGIDGDPSKSLARVCEHDLSDAPHHRDRAVRASPYRADERLAWTAHHHRKRQMAVSSKTSDGR